MPDTLKQFYNATINVTGLTGNQTATLFTNNSTTRAVIKDVVVTNTFPVIPNLTVAGTAVAGLISNLTGSEIVDVSQAVAMSFTSSLAYTSTTTMFLSSSSTHRISNVYNINGIVANTINVDQSLVTIDASASFVTVLYYAPDGDVFSLQTNGDANWFLFKNAGSAGGTRTTINTGNTANNSPIAFDGVNTFYWLSSTTNLRAFNADTETTTNTTITAVASGSTPGPRLVHSNGYLMYQIAGGSIPYIIEISTGRWASFSGTAPNWDQTNAMPGFWFETSTRVATIFWFFSNSGSSNFYYRSVSPAIPAFTAGSVTIGTSWSDVLLPAGSFVSRSAAINNTNTVLTSADGGVINDTGNQPSVLSGLSGPSSGWTITGPIAGSSVSAIWRPRKYANSSPTVNTTNFPNTISLRLTGVEVTP
jgi:hypothetical protein